MIASVAALTDVLPVAGYRYMFAVTLSGGAGALAALLLAGAKNIGEQSSAGRAGLAEAMAAPPPALDGEAGHQERKKPAGD